MRGIIFEILYLIVFGVDELFLGPKYSCANDFTTRIIPVRVPFIGFVFVFIVNIKLCPAIETCLTNSVRKRVYIKKKKRPS